MADGYGRGALLAPTPRTPLVTRPPDPDVPDEPANVVTLVMDGGTAYVLVQILGMTIDNFRRGSPTRGVSVDVLVHAHDELAGQLGDPLYADRERPRGT